MNDAKWQTYLLYGRPLHVLWDDGCWCLRLDDREATAVHLDAAFSALLNVPSHMALQLALSVLNAEPGAEIA